MLRISGTIPSTRALAFLAFSTAKLLHTHTHTYVRTDGRFAYWRRDNKINYLLHTKEGKINRIHNLHHINSLSPLIMANISQVSSCQSADKLIQLHHSSKTF